MDKEFIENLIKDVDDPEFFKEAIRMIAADNLHLLKENKRLALRQISRSS